MPLYGPVLILEKYASRVQILGRAALGGVRDALSLQVANGERLAAFTVDQVEEPPTPTPVKDIHVGDVVECFNGTWNRAIVTHVFVPEDYVCLTRPHMHLDHHSHIPYTQYEQFKVHGPQVVIHDR